MATIRTIRNKHGAVHRAEICARGRRVSRSFDRLSDAQRWAEDAEEMLRAGLPLEDDPPVGNEISFEKALDRYLREVTSRKARTTRAVEEYATRAMREHFGSKPLSDITSETVAAYRDLRMRKVGPATVRKELNLLSHLCNTARIEWGFVDQKNPAADIRKPSPPRGRVRFLTKEEIERLLEASGSSHRPGLREYLVLQLNTGMRPSEGAGLRWNQVDLDARRIHLLETKTDPRTVPLTVAAVEALASLAPPGEWNCSDYVFLGGSPKGSFLSRPGQFYRESFEAACARAKILDFHLHDLRHTAASWLIMSGIDLRTVADILGHRSLSMTMRYTHLLDKHKLAAVDRLAY